MSEDKDFRAVVKMVGAVFGLLIGFIIADSFITKLIKYDLINTAIEKDCGKEILKGLGGEG